MIAKVIQVINIPGSQPYIVHGVKNSDLHKYPHILSGSNGSYVVCDQLATLKIRILIGNRITEFDIKYQIKLHFYIGRLGTRQKELVIRSAPSTVVLDVNPDSNYCSISDVTFIEWYERYKAMA